MTQNPLPSAKEKRCMCRWCCEDRLRKAMNDVWIEPATCQRLKLEWDLCNANTPHEA